MVVPARASEGGSSSYPCSPLPLFPCYPRYPRACPASPRPPCKYAAAGSRGAHNRLTQPAPPRFSVRLLPCFPPSVVRACRVSSRAGRRSSESWSAIILLLFQLFVSSDENRKSVLNDQPEDAIGHARAVGFAAPPVISASGPPPSRNASPRNSAPWVPLWHSVPLDLLSNSVPRVLLRHSAPWVYLRTQCPWTSSVTQFLGSSPGTQCLGFTSGTQCLRSSLAAAGPAAALAAEAATVAPFPPPPPPPPKAKSSPKWAFRWRPGCPTPHKSSQRNSMWPMAPSKSRVSLKADTEAFFGGIAGSQRGANGRTQPQNDYGSICIKGASPCYHLRLR